MQKEDNTVEVLLLYRIWSLILKLQRKDGTDMPASQQGSIIIWAALCAAK
jgi:hypothetical protein